MKIGDQFTQEIPMQIPIANLAPVNLKIVAKYKLKKVEKNLAFFDIVHEYELSQENKEVEFDISGNGEGKLIHDLLMNFFVEHNSNSKMILYAKTAAFTMKCTVFSEFKSTVEINKIN